ncbi:cell division transport system permease protein [Flexibacter flexilis DSM 6793]|uniref:Cell division protein FtsX n=1 Tax=Flexibacter flexilis DSM 6793 TaxID=927664 RepID=A0A1I1DK53_9BACT|nr:permease-like cell division protein FtsX [Flexibacter flexilis]SFB73090.1 cell division transport system permease protein [Flexibacter flexilis DSM 6793]
MANNRSYKKKTLGSYPYFTVVLSIVTALFVIGLFGLVLLHANRLSELIRENIEVRVYLQRNIADTERLALQNALAATPYVDTESGKSQIKFISKEKAAENFIAETGENFIKLLGENPLRDAFVLRIRADYSDTEKMKQIKREIEKMNGVFEVEYVESLVNSVNNNIAKIGLVLLTLSFVLILTVILLINNTIKLAVFSQRFLIRSMQLVGATSWFIQRPFVFRAAFQGLISGVLAALLLSSLLQYANNLIPELKQLQNSTEITGLFISLLVVGCVIGALSTLASVRRFVSLSLDELY